MILPPSTPGLHFFAVEPAGLCRACSVRRCRIVEGSSSARGWRVGTNDNPAHEIPDNGRQPAPVRQVSEHQGGRQTTSEG
jgi:hypothetical protein